jgi:hypothetical protein
MSETLYRVTLNKLVKRGKGLVRVGSRHRAEWTVMANPGAVESVEKLTCEVEDVTDEFVTE